MGSGRFDPGAYRTYSDSIRHTTHVKEVLTRESLSKDLDPFGVLVRESRDSGDNPNSTPVIIAIDQTGSMGMLAHAIIKENLGVIMNEIFDRKPITDPHLMFMAIGDAENQNGGSGSRSKHYPHEEAPLQVSQFEADNRIVDQLKEVLIEGNGGGNMGESYNLAWYFAALHTSIDSFEKRGKKGFLFTVGDEPCLDPLAREAVKRYIGDSPERDLTNAELVEAAGRMYHVFHVVVEEGSHCRHYGAEKVIDGWRKLLGQNVLPLQDHTKLGEVIVSTLQVVAGVDKEDVIKSWSGGTSLIVAKAIDSLTKVGDPAAVGGVVKV